MRNGAETDTRPPPRAVTYCIVPRELVPELHELLRRHFREDPSVAVVVEQRGRERRQRDDRRAGPPALDHPKDQRKVKALTGRRVADRRVTAVAVEPPPLPRKARTHLKHLIFIERLEPSEQHAEDVDTARLVARIQAGNKDEFAALYMRYFDRVYSYLRVALNDPHEAEDVSQQVFLKVMEALPDYERRAQPFRAWLFIVSRNHAIKRLRERSRVALEGPGQMDRHAERSNREEDAELRALNWITDADLIHLIERLPFAQRQVLVLRYMLDLTHKEIAAILDREPADVRVLHHRAVRFLQQRLAALGREPGHSRPARWQRISKHANVLRSRRFALSP